MRLDCKIYYDAYGLPLYCRYRITPQPEQPKKMTGHKVTARQLSPLHDADDLHDIYKNKLDEIDWND